MIFVVEVQTVLLQEPWYYEELQPEPDDYEEPEADSDFDYEESLSKRKKKKAATVKTPAKVCFKWKLFH